ncbi:SIS domain-containing protein [Pseudoprimorskyibacter insulae]|uniref:SIS domain-containing protein n=1 Tax=Pseudoprimorskyibacter insulae TaxID=1695997 RepID=UPI001C62A03D
MTNQDVLVGVSFRCYANEVVSIVHDTREKEVETVAISDSTLSPLAKSADAFFAVPESRHRFSRSIAAPPCVAMLLSLRRLPVCRAGQHTLKFQL